MVRLRSMEAHLREKLKDPQFRKGYELQVEKMKIVSVVIGYRIKRRLTQTQLAKKIGVTQQQVSKIEEGEFSNLATVEKVLRALGYRVVVRAVPLKKQYTLKAAA